MGFGQGLSGLNAAAQNLDVIGNNIANSGTVGFKTGTATFADVYANSRVGLGTKVAGINQRFTVGTVSSTGNQFDMAIDGPKGLFRVQDTSGNVLFTRNGQFFADKDNYIVNAQGQRLTGYAGTGTNLSPIMVPAGNIAPQATTAIGMTTNLSAKAPLAGGEVLEVTGQIILSDSATNPPVAYGYTIAANGDVSWVTAPTGGPFFDGATELTALDLNDPATFPKGGSNVEFVKAVPAKDFNPDDATTYTDMLPITVYDSLGNSHQLTQYFAKRPSPAAGESEWDVYYRLNGVALPAPSDTTKLKFDNEGRLQGDTAFVLNVTPPAGLSPAAPLTIRVDYLGSTQFGGEFSSSFTPNGFTTGEYTSMSISSDGSIVASYTNGETQHMGYLALADFKNLQGLQPAGGNAWAETSESGQPTVGRPGTNGMASIVGQSVEESNVDMSQELVNMIIAQRTYQANAQTIKTQDQVMQTLINLR